MNESAGVALLGVARLTLSAVPAVAAGVAS